MTSPTVSSGAASDEDPAGRAAPSTPVVIVTYSVEPEVLERCLRSVVDAGGAGRVVLVDNGGGAVLPPGLDVRILRPGANRGFGAAANAGIELALADGADRVALLNDDVEVEPGWLRPLEEALDRDVQVGAVQPKLLLARTDPVLVNSVGVEIGADGAGRDVGHGEPDDSRFESSRRIDAFTGGAVLFRRRFFEDTGGFDERYFLYYEDVDLALRGAESGWTYRCEPASRVRHAPGTSTSHIGDRLVVLQERNRLWTAVRFGPPRLIRSAFWLSVRRLRHSPRTAHARGLAAGVRAMPRLLVERRRAVRRGAGSAAVGR
ncbi:MAG: glycosyltransferase family 2 protein [Ilumatobacteraceae bacterium]